MSEKPWWFPVLIDEKWVRQIREDYPEAAELDDEEIRHHYGDGQKYSTTWDHIGDAYPEYEKLADAYLALLAEVGRDA